MTAHPYRNLIFLPCLILAVLLLVIDLISPFVANYYLTNYFEQQGEKASIGSLSMGFFPPHLALKEVKISQADKVTLSLKAADLKIDLLPLLSRSVHINTAKLDGLELSVAQYQDSWRIAGIKLDQYRTQTKPSQPKVESTTSSPWSITLPHFAFTNSVIHLSRQPAANAITQMDTLEINTLSATDLSGRALDWQGQVALSAKLNQASLAINSRFHYSPQRANATVSIDHSNLTFSSLRHFLPSPYNAGKGQVTIKGKFSFSQQTDKAEPSYKLSHLDLTAHAENLDMMLDKRHHIATKSTLLDLNKVQIYYGGVHDLSVKGDLSLLSQHSQISDADQQLALNQLKLDTDLELDRQPHATRFNSQQTSLFLEQLAAQLPNQQSIKLATLSLSLPIEMTLSEQGLSATSVNTALDTEDLSIALDSIVLNSDKTHLTLSQLTLAQDAQNVITAAVKSHLQSHHLSLQQAGITSNFQDIRASSTTSFSQNGDNMRLQNAQLTLDIKAMRAQRAQQEQLSLKTAQLSAAQLDVELANGQAPSIIGNHIDFASQGFDAKLGENKRLAAWQKAQLTDLDFSSQGNHYTAKLVQLALSDLTLSEVLNTPQPLAPLTQINKIEIQQLAANQDGAEVKQIITDSATVNVLLDNKKRLENLVFIGKAEQEARAPSDKGPITPKKKDLQKVKSTSPKGQQEPFKAPYYVVLEAYDMTGKSSIHVTDKSTSPHLQRSLQINTLSLRNLNTRDKGQAAVFTLQARSGKYTSINNTIRVWPTADELTMQSKLLVKEAELPPYSAYLANVLGYQIDSGQLDLNLTLNANNGKLDGNAHLVLREFDLGGRKESHSVVKAGVVPLNLAVSALKDSDNNIDLDIPLSGNIENPEFGWQDFLLLPVRKALFSVSSSYLIQTFVPYANVISIAQFAGEQLLKIRVEPLLFPPQEAKLNADQNTFLEQLVALMKAKDESQLKACGVASYLDLGLDKSPANIDKETQAKAHKLAVQRASHLKDYLVANGISSARIFLCAPEVDLTPGSQPRVELNF